MEQLVSVIVPVYNVEKYLDECVYSLIHQSYKTIEIILVDDGSTDQSGVKCDFWKEKDNRIIVIHQENKGISGARNSGIDVASGDYLAFVDSDDYVEENYIELMYHEMAKNNCDFVMCNFISFDEEQQRFDGKNRIYDAFMNSEEFMKMVYTYPGFYVLAWNKLYKKELFQKTRYETRRNEDSALISKLVFQCNKIQCISVPLYFYRQRENSLMHDKNELGLLEGELSWIKRDIKLYRTLKKEELMHWAIKLYCNKIVEKYEVLDNDNKKKYQKELRQQCPKVFKCKLFTKKVRLKFFICFISVRVYNRIENIINYHI